MFSGAGYSCFMYLTRFDCSNNQLKDLPSSIGGCVDLTEFKVIIYEMYALLELEKLQFQVQFIGFVI